MNAKRDVDDENDGETFVEEQEMCDGRIFFVTFFFRTEKNVYPINIIKTNH